jgi:hypothetical protein
MAPLPEDLRPPYRIQFDNARDPYSARNALGITSTGGGGGAPTDAQYIVAADDPTLTNDRVLTNTATVTWDFTTPGQAKANAATGGGGNVSNSGTPTLGQYAKWVTATTIQGVAPATVLADIGAQPAGNYQPLDADLTSLAAASAIGAIYYRSAANTWATVTIGTGLSFSGGTLASTVSGGGDVFANLSNTFTQPNFFTAKVVLGHISAILPNYGLELHGTSAASGLGGSIGSAKWSADAFGGSISLFKSRGATIDAHTAVVAGDNLGSIQFNGSNGSAFPTLAQIYSTARAALSAELNFWTNNGSAGAERMRLHPSGGLAVNSTFTDPGAGRIGSNGLVVLQPGDVAGEGLITYNAAGSVAANLYAINFNINLQNSSASGAINLYASGTPLAVFAPSGCSIRGNSGASDQSVGFVGEYKTASASSVALGAGAYTATATLAIPAGDWDIRGVVRVNGTAGSYMYCNVYTLTASSSGSPDDTQTGIFTGLGDVWTAVGPFRKRLSAASTTFYLNVYMAIAGTLVFGEIQARRRN